MYAYVGNNPLTYIDPSGLCLQSADGDYLDGDNGGTFLFKGPCIQGNTATATKDIDNAALYRAWANGDLPSRIDYDKDDPMTVNLRDFANFRRAVREHVKAGCPAEADISVGHCEAAFESLENALVGPSNPTQFQLGGYSGVITSNGNGSVTYTVRNGMTNSSFLAINTISDTFKMNKRGARDNPYGPTGPRHNVLQVFQWSGPNPCR